MDVYRQIAMMYARQAVAPLSAYGVAMWLYLLHRANLARWQMPLVLRESEICGACGMSHVTYIKTRRALAEGGYIRYVPQPGRRSPHYWIEQLYGQ